MEQGFSLITELSEIRKIKNEILEREEQLSTPKLVDLGLIPEIYKWFCESLSNRDFPPQTDSPYQRKKFIFIILYLYAPSCFAGSRLSGRIREELAKAVGCHPTYISHNIENVIFYFQQYKDFGGDVVRIYNEIIDRLKAKGIIR